MQQSGRPLANPVSGSYLPARQTVATTPAPSAGLQAAVQPHAGYDLLKRCLDLLLAALLLVVTLPLLVIACLLIWLSSRESPVLIQRRVGRLGRDFTMLKLRTMRACDAVGGGEASRDVIAPKEPHNCRVTAIGVILRRTSIDELPQLLNVLAGQMSLVGPRPGLPSEVRRYPMSWRRRLSVKPGLSGLWQVSGRSEVEPRRWMAMDRLYLQRRSIGLDCVILVRTVLAVVSMRGAW